jgi:DNA-binding LacI/PurR family transcriptional regulator
VAPIPFANQAAGPSNGFAIARGQKHKHLAWEFIRMITSRWWMERYGEMTGVTPAMQGAVSERTLQHYPWLSVFAANENAGKSYLVPGLQDVDGVIVAPAPGDHRFLGSYLSRRWPVVAINRRVDGMAIPAVLPDNAGGSMLATRHLLGHGHRRIGLVAPRTSPSSVRERIEGHAHCLRAAGVRHDTRLLAAEDGSVQGGIAAVRRLLGLDVPPTALLSLSSVMSLGVLVALRESGVSVPGDVALIGFDEAAWSVAVSPPLTSVDLRADIVGRNATRLLLDWIEEKKPPRLLEYRVPSVLIERRSCGCTRLAAM